MEDQPTNEAQDEKSYCDVCGQSPARTCYSSYAHLCNKHYGEQKDEQQPVENNENSKWFCKKCKEFAVFQHHCHYKANDYKALNAVFKEKIFLENKELEENIKPFLQKVLDLISKQQLEIETAYKTAKELLETCERLLHEQVKSAADYLANVLQEKEKKQLNRIEHLQKVFEEKVDNLESVILKNSNLLSSDDKSIYCKFESNIADFRTYPELTQLNGLEKPEFKPNLLVHETFPHFMGEFIYQGTENPISQFDIKTDNLEMVQKHLQQHPVVLKVLQSSSPTQGSFDFATVSPCRVLTSGAEKRVHMLDANMRNDSLQTYKVSYVSSYIAFSSFRGIYYSDRRDNTIKKIENMNSNKIDTVLYFFDEKNPRGIAFNSFGHLLVCVYSKKRSVVERYDKNIIKVQEIEHNDGKPLYEEPCFVCCNRNGDVCVADHGLHSVVVVDQFGVFQFSYEGQNEKSFRPYSLATDHFCNIVITDNVNHEIHLLDKYGQFLRFLTTEPTILTPGAVAIDRKGKLWIGESMSGKVHVIKYLGGNLLNNPVQRPTALTFGDVIRSSTITRFSKVV